MKRKFGLLFIIIVVLMLGGAGGMWLHGQKRQYQLNRALIHTLTQHDTKTALALVNAGADPNTRYAPTPAPSLQLLLHQLLHHAPPPVNDSPTALVMVCGTMWYSMTGPAVMPVYLEEDLPLIRTMLAHGANVHATTFHHVTALHCAIDVDRLHTAELLVQYGADVNAQDERGQTPFFIAAVRDSKNIVQLLLSHKANPNIQDTFGTSPLGIAVQRPDPNNIIPLILAHGADPTLCDSMGRPPLQLAYAMNRPKLMRWLKRGEWR